jgi:CRP-like cAMP-binding protein
MSLSILERVFLLKSCAIFSDIEENILLDLAATCEEASFYDGEIVISKGDMGDHLYIIRQGSLIVFDKETILAELHEAEVVGEMSLLDPGPRNAFVRANGEVLLLRVDRDVFIELLASEEEAMNGVLRVLTRRITRQNEKILELENKLRP